MVKVGKYTWLWLVWVNALVIGRAEQLLPRFEDYPVAKIFKGKPATPRLTSPDTLAYRTRIRNGVEKGLGVYGKDRKEGSAGPNFAGHYIVIRWGCGSPCLQLAVIDAESGDVSPPPITAEGIFASGYTLPLLTPGNRVSRNAEIDFRLDSRLMIIRATPEQTKSHPSYDYYFVRNPNAWSLIKRVPIRDDAASGEN